MSESKETWQDKQDAKYYEDRAHRAQVHEDLTALKLTEITLNYYLKLLEIVSPISPSRIPDAMDCFTRRAAKEEVLDTYKQIKESLDT
jgi:hypothetical protein